MNRKQPIVGLTDEPAQMFRPRLAAELTNAYGPTAGVKFAIALEVAHRHMQTRAQVQTVSWDGEKRSMWIFHWTPEMQASDFPFWNEGQIRKLLGNPDIKKPTSNLVRENLLLRGSAKDKGCVSDHWYSLNYKTIGSVIKLHLVLEFGSRDGTESVGFAGGWGYPATGDSADTPTISSVTPTKSPEPPRISPVTPRISSVTPTKSPELSTENGEIVARSMGAGAHVRAEDSSYSSLLKEEEKYSSVQTAKSPPTQRQDLDLLAQARKALTDHGFSPQEASRRSRSDHDARIALAQVMSVTLLRQAGYAFKPWPPTGYLKTAIERGFVLITDAEGAARRVQAQVAKRIEKARQAEQANVRQANDLKAVNPALLPHVDRLTTAPPKPAMTEAQAERLRMQAEVDQGVSHLSDQQWDDVVREMQKENILRLFDRKRDLTRGNPEMRRQVYYHLERKSGFALVRSTTPAGKEQRS